MHHKSCLDPRFERLIERCIHLLEYFVSPTRDETSRVHSLVNSLRRFARERPPELLNDIEAENSFAVHFDQGKKRLEKDPNTNRTRQRSENQRSQT